MKCYDLLHELTEDGLDSALRCDEEIPAVGACTLTAILEALFGGLQLWVELEQFVAVAGCASNIPSPQILFFGIRVYHDTPGLPDGIRLC